MKILHIIRSSNIGGIERFAYYLIQAQKLNPELEIGVLVCKKKGGLKTKFKELGVPAYFIEFGPKEVKPEKFRRLNKLALQYDIIHFHFFIPQINWYLFLKNHTIIYTNHSVYGFGRKRKATSTIKRYLFKKFLNRKNLTLTYNSNYTKDFWESRGIINYNSKVIYNGVFFKNAKEDILKVDLALPDKFLIGTTSRLIKLKRVDYLIKAFYKFQKGKDDVHLVIIGDGDEKEKLIKLAESLNIIKSVTFTGNVINVEDYHSLLDVCVSTSTTESFGLVAIECMSFGKPVIVMKDGGGITEILKNIEPNNIINDINSLSRRLQYYYNINGVKIDERIFKRKAFAASFDMKETEKKYYKLYSKILSKD